MTTGARQFSLKDLFWWTSWICLLAGYTGFGVAVVNQQGAAAVGFAVALTAHSIVLSKYARTPARCLAMFANFIGVSVLVLYVLSWL